MSKVGARLQPDRSQGSNIRGQLKPPGERHFALRMNMTRSSFGLIMSHIFVRPAQSAASSATLLLAILTSRCSLFGRGSFEGCLGREEGKTGPQEDLRFLDFEAELGHQCRGPRVDDLVALRQVLLPRPNVLAHERV